MANDSAVLLAPAVNYIDADDDAGKMLSLRDDLATLIQSLQRVAPAPKVGGDSN